MVHATVDATVTGSAVDDTTGGGINTRYFKRDLHAETEVACNEKVYDKWWKGLFGYAKTFIDSRGGFF
jgi:hypothetical protein